MRPDEKVLLTGVCHTAKGFTHYKGIGFFVATSGGIHYAFNEKAGMFKKRTLTDVLPRPELREVAVEQITRTFASLDIVKSDGSVGARFVFEDEFDPRLTARGQAERLADLIRSELIER
jgi:hypothetical protein